MKIKSVQEVIRKSGKNVGKPYYQVIMENNRKYLCDEDIRFFVNADVSYGEKQVGETTWISNVRRKSDRIEEATTAQSSSQPQSSKSSYAGHASSFASSYAKDVVNELIRGCVQHVSPMETEIIKKTLEELRPVIADNLLYYMEFFEERMKG